MSWIAMMLDEAGVPENSGFAFTLQLPAVPRVGETVFVGGRRFRVLEVEWRAHDGAFPVRLFAEELFAERRVAMMSR